MQMWKTVDFCKSQYSSLKHFQIFSRHIRQSGSFLTILKNSKYPSYDIKKWVKRRNTLYVYNYI